jgi:hypothetical protein
LNCGNDAPRQAAMQRPALRSVHMRPSRRSRRNFAVRIKSRPARCVPSPQRGEGQDEGGQTSEINLNLPNALTPTLSPLGRRSSLCRLLRICMASTFVLAAHLGARVFRRAIRTERASAKDCHVQRETGSVQGKGRGGAWLSVFRSWFRSPDGAQRNPGRPFRWSIAFRRQRPNRYAAVRDAMGHCRPKCVAAKLAVIFGPCP